MTYSEVEPNENRVFRCLFRHPRPLVAEIDMVGYGDGRLTSSRDALFAIAMYRRVLPLFAASTKFRLVYLGHERTTMTSETSKNTRCHLMLTLQIANRLSCKN